MATRAEIAISYDSIDAIHRASLGEHADVSCAFYDGDDSLTLEEAQRRKHSLVLAQLGLQRGSTLLDIGCGWGPLLAAARERGVTATGITLSAAQVARCTARGLDARLRDWRELDARQDGGFDGIASIGAFEHFATADDALAERQEDVYRDFFRRCRSLLPAGGRLFLQTMTWGRRVPHARELDVRAPKLSDEWIMGHIAYLYPGSWLPDGLEQIAACAVPYFELGWHSNGRLDYIRTMRAWRRAFADLGVRRWAVVSPLLGRALVDPHMRRLLVALRHACVQLCFEREIFTHWRMVLHAVGERED